MNEVRDCFCSCHVPGTIDKTGRSFPCKKCVCWAHWNCPVVEIKSVSQKQVDEMDKQSIYEQLKDLTNRIKHLEEKNLKITVREIACDLCKGKGTLGGWVIRKGEETQEVKVTCASCDGDGFLWV